MDDEAAGWFSEQTATFGDRLAAAREGSGLTQKDLANRLGVKPGTLRNWEDDLAEPRANRLQMLAGMLGVSLTWLLTGKGDGPDAPGESSSLGDLGAVLTEIRQLKGQLGIATERLGHLEKRLRLIAREAV